MPRQVWPQALTLSAAWLNDPQAPGASQAQSGGIKQAMARLDRAFPDPRGRDHSGAAVSLRWSATPRLGLPRQPFKVYRRPPVRKFVDLPAKVAVDGEANVSFGPRILCEVLVQATPAANSTMRVEAIDVRGEVFPGQRIDFTAPRQGRFRVCGIAGLRVHGKGSIDHASGVDETALANEPDWQLFEIVGLPFVKGEAALPVYDPQPQGLAPGSLPGREAAAVRLDVLNDVQLPIPPTGIPALPAPAWPIPDSGTYLTILCDLSLCLFNLVKECLAHSADSDPLNLQAAYRHKTVPLPGITQLGDATAKPGTDATTMEIPVVGVAMLAIGGDSLAATALGYGTIDFPPHLVQSARPVASGLPAATARPATSALSGAPATTVTAPVPPPVPPPVSPPVSPQAPQEPPGAAALPFDYMVSATFTLPGLGVVEIAAIADGRAAPEPPALRRTRPLHLNRPAQLDAALSQAVELSWNLAPQPQGYAIAVSRAPKQSEVLNPPRPGVPILFQPGLQPPGPVPLPGDLPPFHPVPATRSVGFDLFFPNRPGTIDGDLPADAQAVFVDQLAPLPLTSSASSTYLVAGQDVHGRWTSWKATAPALAPPPPPVSTPAIHSAAFLLDPAHAKGRLVPAALEVELSWDWSERSPDRIELAGRFFPAAAAPDPGPPAGLALSAGAPGPLLVVKFDHAGNPSILAPYTGTVEILRFAPADPSRPPDVGSPSYRATISVFHCDFNAAAELAYEIYARGFEAVRPAEPSVFVGPKLARTFDPLPPAVPQLVVDLRWTALPDATGVARGVLTWPASPAAAGYAVWEATESALRHVLGAPPPPNAPLAARAKDLQQLITASAASQAASLHAFSRVNARQVAETRMELALPGSSSAIYAYRVSAVSTANVESAKSAGVALLAVPRRNLPAAPRLMLRAAKTKGIDVIVVPGPGVAPVGYRVYRVRGAGLLDDLGAMGPPRYLEKDAGWRDLDVASLQGVIEKGRALTDPVPQSWYPWYYRVVAIGAEDLANGVYGGESPASAVQSLLLPPPLPTLDGFAVSAATLEVVASFRTNLPVRPTPLGVSRIEVVQLKQTNGRIDRVTLLAVAPEAVPEAPPLVPLPHPPLAQLKSLPLITRRPPNPQGVAEYTVMVRADAVPLAVTVTDPRGRTAEGGS
jgi:hypothetical protein